LRNGKTAEQCGQPCHFQQRYHDRLNTLGGSLEEADTILMDDPALATVPSFEILTSGDAEPAAVDPAGAGAAEFEWNSVAEDDSPHGGVSFADLNETEESSEKSTESLPDPMLADQFAGVAESAGGATTQEDGKAASSEKQMQQELESVDFYITQGYSDIAIDTLDLLERQFGPHREIDSRRKKLRTGSESSEATVFQAVSEPALSGSGTPEKGFKSDAAFGEVDIEQPPVAVPAAPVGSGIDSGLAEIFEEFRMEAEGESAPSHEDYETHFNMATAYKEMDLLDEAIREFQVAAGLTGSADGTRRYFQCCNMLGHCFVEKSMPQAAVLWFKKGLEAPGRNAEESKALQYELGSAYEAMGDLKHAVEAFTEVYGVDVGYRDIGEKLASLQVRIEKKKKGK